jgi:hypothetical protein
MNATQPHFNDLEFDAESVNTSGSAFLPISCVFTVGSQKITHYFCCRDSATDGKKRQGIFR